MTLPRGFRTEAEAKARYTREQLGIADTDIVDIEKLAEAVGVSVISGEKLVGRKPFEELNVIQDGVFSAATFDFDDRKIIVTNPIASVERTRSDIAHELGHVFLKHQLSEVRRIGEVPFLTCRPEEEEQATAFGSILLLPRDTLKAEIARGNDTPQKLAKAQKVSVEMARFRLNTSGVLKRN